jgi:hypothetical protein
VTKPRHITTTNNVECPSFLSKKIGRLLSVVITAINYGADLFNAWWFDCCEVFGLTFAKCSQN